MLNFFFYSLMLAVAAFTHAQQHTDHTSLNCENEGFIETNGARLFYRTYGKGSPVVIVHGGPGLSQEYLLPAMSTLASDHFVIFYDQRGSGQSTGDITAENMSIEHFIADIEAIRQAFHFDKISILGHSWGGFLAMHYATLHPEHVDKLILSNTAPATSEGFAAFGREWTRRLKPFESEMAEIHATAAYAGGDPATVEYMQRLIFRTYTFQAEKADLLALRVTKQANVNGAKVNALLRSNVLFKPFDLLPELHKLKIKTLVLHGDSDPIPLATAEQIHAAIPESTLLVLKNCGHFPYVEQPTEYFSALKAFLK